MEWCGSIDVEDEPLILLDQYSVALWAGIADDGADYTRAYSVLDNNPDGGVVKVGSHLGFVWYPDGAGTVDVFLSTPDTVIILRSWLSGTIVRDDNQDVLHDFAKLTTLKKTKIGEVAFTLGEVVITPATSDALEIMRFQNNPSRLANESMNAIFVPLPSGTYQCSKGEVDNFNGSAISLILQRNYI